MTEPPTNWQARALMTKRPGQPCMRTGTYGAVDVVTGEPWHNADGQPYRSAVKASKPFPRLPHNWLAWQWIGDDDAEAVPV